MTARLSVDAFSLFASLLTVLFVHGNVLADEALPFTERSGLKYVTVHINGVPMELVFDTGANSVVLNSAALQRLGIMEFNASRRLNSHTAGGVVEGYIITLNSIKAGNILKRYYDVAYIPSSTENLLGAPFFENYSYFIDEDYKVIRLIPKGSFIFENPEKPVADRPKNGSGRIEVEIDGKKYIFGEGWEEEKEQDTPKEEQRASQEDSLL
ncbi:MAG: retropepsin-like aspartic protease family protein [Nitrospirota bacterium]